LRGVKVSRHVKKSGIGGSRHEKHESGGGLVSDLVVTKFGGKVVVMFVVIRESDIFVRIRVKSPRRGWREIGEHLFEEIVVMECIIVVVVDLDM
jgi:hypothetical protein